MSKEGDQYLAGGQDDSAAVLAVEATLNKHQQNRYSALVQVLLAATFEAAFEVASRADEVVGLEEASAAIEVGMEAEVGSDIKVEVASEVDRLPMPPADQADEVGMVATTNAEMGMGVAVAVGMAEVVIVAPQAATETLLVVAETDMTTGIDMVVAGEMTTMVESDTTTAISTTTPGQNVVISDGAARSRVHHGVLGYCIIARARHFYGMLVGMDPFSALLSSGL